MNPFRAILLTLLLLAGVNGGSAATFLFDATKAETAANADWVIDEDNHVAGRYPTPPASGITASTPETYWTGALSSWGVALVQLGHNVESLPVGGRITYLDSSNAQDLSNYQVYVVCEPNILFTAAEKSAIARYVQAGGSLFVISDHSGSDRNNDGYDSVAVWNDFFANNGVQANPFGVTINSTSVSVVSTFYDSASDDPLTNGQSGPATVLKYSSGATMTINPTANSSVRGAFWSSSSRTNSNVMAAYGSYGAGRFAVLGDSSPPDDGTGSSGHTLYYGWTEEGANHSNLILNASLWLSQAQNGGAPYNDNFANAGRLDPTATAAAGTNAGASKEAGEPDHANNPGGASVWWQFTAANTGTATVTTAGSDFDTLLAIYTGSSASALSLIASNDNVDASHPTSAVSFPVTAGSTYRIAVDGANGSSGKIVLGLAFPPPVNDNFASAVAVPFTGNGGAAVTSTGNNFNATSESGEPNHAGYFGGRSVWTRWTASNSGPVTISTVGSDFDTLLAVYTGASVNALTAVASNANYGALLQSQVSFTATAGVTYSVAVDGYSGLTGNITLAFSSGSSSNTPVNDNFAGATPLSGASATGSASTVYASKEAGEPNHAGNAGGHSVWWRWNAPADGTVTITTIGSNFDTTLGVYTGTSVNALTTLASDDDSAGSQKSKVIFNVTADSTYLIAIDGFGSGAGTATLNISFSASYPAPPNDNFASATALSGAAPSAYGNNVNATAEAGEPVAYGTGHSIWWRWTAPSNLIVTAYSSGNYFTTSLGVYTGSALNALTGVGISPSGNLGFSATAGVTYYFLVDGQSGGVGNVTLSLSTQAPPTVSIAATTPGAAEKGSVAGVFTLTFGTSSPVATTVNVTLSGSATLGADYYTTPGAANGATVAVTLPPYSSSATLRVTPIDDSDAAEGDEFVVAMLTAGNGYAVNSNAGFATVTIHDDSPYNNAWSAQFRSGGFTGANAAPLADPDHDGIPNVLEFAFNLNPLASDAPTDGMPAVDSAMFTDPTDGAPHRYLTLTFTRRKDSPNLTYNVQEATTIGGAWMANVAVLISATQSPNNAVAETAVYRSAYPLEGPDAVAQQFLRVSVVATPQ